MSNSSPEIEKIFKQIESKYGRGYDSSQRELLIKTLQSVDLDSLNDEDIIDLATVGETHFFRDPDYLKILVNDYKESNFQNFNIASVGCSSGEEAYTITMELQKEAKKLNLNIVGFDLNERHIQKARSGKFSEWSFRNTDKNIKETYFTKQDTHYLLNSSIRDKVSFKQYNLLDTIPLKFHQFFDVIMCRNILIYFSPDALTVAFSNLEKLLKPSGKLFLGSGESYLESGTHFSLENINNVYFYCKKNSVQNSDVKNKDIQITKKPIVLKDQESKNINAPYKPTAQELMESNKTEEAIEALLNNIKKQDNPIDYFHLGVLILKKGETTKALGYLNEASLLSNKQIEDNIKIDENIELLKCINLVVEKYE